jgi:uncharacterized membrane protein
MTVQHSIASLPTRPGHPGRQRSWPIPVALIALSTVPVLAGALRLLQLAGGPAVLPAERRFTDFPLPLVVHIVGATTYALLGAFQLVPRFRRRHLAWHRRTGRVLAVAGLLVAASALWMTLFYLRQPGTGDLLYALRLVFGSAMAACLVLGMTTIRRGDVVAHRAWMIRAYAIGLAAGTQAFTIGIGAALVGTSGVRGDLASAAGWAINLAIAEWLIRRNRRVGARPVQVAAYVSGQSIHRRRSS